eukprot:TRINITY_DN10357_c0_g1_i1.p1 TRINITY_DN10357_c0_g1~~TRINITY_DN10357_c0_g1_i1.p1  ORF type:complete len:385 (-),score=50.77 TRINITY_DN10357_c0_g1_i1:261-1373(-)
MACGRYSGMASRRCLRPNFLAYSLEVEVRPPLLSSHQVQRRWDTSPYRLVHRLTKEKMNKVEWPRHGSVAWRPSWGRDPPPLYDAGDENFWDFTDTPPPPRSAPAVASTSASKPATRDQLLHRRLVECLGLSAAEAICLIQRGRVQVNGRRRLRDGWISSADELSVNGRPLETMGDYALLVNKPAGYVLTETDPLARPTYVSLLPDPTVVVQPASRIDPSSSGLLLLTTQRSMVEALARPELIVVFDVQLRAPLSSWQLGRLRRDGAFGQNAEACSVMSGLELAELDEADAHATAIPMQARHSALRVALRGPAANAATLRRSLSDVGAVPAPRGLDCIAVGPLSLRGHDGPHQPGDARPLAEAEKDALLA